MNFNRLKNQILAKLLTRFPALAHRAADNIAPLKFDQTPWAPLPGPLSGLKLALVTTAGVHLKTDEPFDMVDKDGDPSFRVVPSDTPVDNLKITHDYYDHTDAEKDINIVFPVDRLKELRDEGRIGSLAPRFFGFMGHINEKHIPRFIEESVPAAAKMMREDGVQAALITPG